MGINTFFEGGVNPCKIFYRIPGGNFESYNHNICFKKCTFYV